MKKSAKILFEESATPIYQRIINALLRSFEMAGHETTLIRPIDNRPREYAKRINSIDPDFVFITNPHSLLSLYDFRRSRFLFEALKSHLVFLHHDNLFGPIFDLDEICRRLEAFIRTSGRSTHLCIEDTNVHDLKRLSVTNAYKIFHASEFVAKHDSGKYEYNITFVGHVLPEKMLANGMVLNDPLLKLVMGDYKKRADDYSYKIEGSAVNYADTRCKSNRNVLKWLGYKQLYRAYAHNLSLFFRGRTLCSIADKVAVDIIGGDPSYIHGKQGNNNIDCMNVRVHPPPEKYAGTDRIYSGSRINLNITPLQFDTALINRVLDAGAAGGFILTDWKDDILGLPVCEQISYRSMGELMEKIELYSVNDRYRIEVAKELHNAVKRDFTYDALVKRMMEML